MRLVPDMATRWHSAAVQDIAAIEALAAHELPSCYRWLLHRLGTGLRDIAYRTLDFSARGVLEGYGRGLFPHHEGMLCIANDAARWQPQLRYYDLAHASERDAPVWMTMPDEDALAPDHPSLRELIGAGVFDNFRRRTQPARLEGLLSREDEGAVVEELLPCLEAHGFLAPIPCGPLCLLYDDGVVAFSSQDDGSMPHIVAFYASAPTVGDLRRFLGIITTSTTIVAKSLNWNSSL